MNINIAKGCYVVAVSGGVDSTVLLDLLVKNSKPGIRLIVAHFDHGIRHDSELDRKIAQNQAKKLGLNFVYDEGKLGANTSEAKARDARYEFLNKVKNASNAEAIITAHHKDDLIETAIINLIRGSGRRGVSSMASGKELLRPLLSYTKKDILDYANENNLVWRDDPSNKDTKYLRNYVRNVLLPKLESDKLEEFHDIISSTKETNEQLEKELADVLHLCMDGRELHRTKFVSLPHDVSKEIMIAWLASNGVGGLDKKQIETIVVASKTSQKNRIIVVNKTTRIRVNGQTLKLETDFDSNRAGNSV